MDAMKQPAMKQSSAQHQRGWFAPYSLDQLTYVGLAVLLFALRGLLMMLGPAVDSAQQPPWLSVVIVVVLGWIGLRLMETTGFPEFWSQVVSSRQRFVLPLLLGMGMGVLLLALDLWQPLGSEFQTVFPVSLVVFAFGGLFEEIIVHLFLLPAAIWLFSSLLLRGRYQIWVFWTVAILSGLLYWLLQVMTLATYLPESFSPLLAVQLFLVITGVIVGGAYLFRRSGFLAALTFRYGFYLIWHIVWGGGIGLVRYWL